MKLLREFEEFAVKGSVVDLAVGVIVGGAFSKLVASFLSDMLMPPLGLLTGGASFNEQRLVLREAAAGGKPVTLNYGAFIMTIIDFTILMFAVFLMVKAINRLRRQQPAAADSKPCSECLTAIPRAARRCASCGQPQEA